MSALRDALRDLPDAVFADMLESDDAYLLVIDLPGVTAGTVDVTVEDRRVTIEARREKAHPPEFRYVSEDRSLFLDAELPLPPDARSEGGSASMERGVLEVRLPKRGEEAATRIEILGDDVGDGNEDGNGDGDGNGDEPEGDAGDGNDAGDGSGSSEGGGETGDGNESGTNDGT